MEGERDGVGDRRLEKGSGEREKEMANVLEEGESGWREGDRERWRELWRVRESAREREGYREARRDRLPAVLVSYQMQAILPSSCFQCSLQGITYSTEPLALPLSLLAC